MKHLALLSPILLAACVQHQDPCVVQKLNCNPILQECACETSGKDPVRVVSHPNPDVSVGGNGGSSDGNGVVSDDTNGDVSSDKSSDKSKDRPGKGDKSSDSNGDNSHE